VAHSYNPSYSGSRDQEDCGSKSAQENSLRDCTLKKPITKKRLMKWPSVQVSVPHTKKTIKAKTLKKRKHHKQTRTGRRKNVRD
jgi:hypothetical protein